MNGAQPPFDTLHSTRVSVAPHSFRGGFAKKRFRQKQEIVGGNSSRAQPKRGMTVGNSRQVILNGERVSVTPDRLNRNEEWLSGTPDRFNLNGKRVSGTPDRFNQNGERVSGTPDRFNLNGKWLSGTPDRFNRIGEWQS